MRGNERSGELANPSVQVLWLSESTLARLFKRRLGGADHRVKYEVRERRRNGVQQRVQPRSVPEEASLEGGRPHGDPHHHVVGPGVPRGLPGHLLHRRGRQARQGRGRSQLAVQPGSPVHALPRAARARESREPPEVPDEARRRARRGQVGARELGRGVRHHLRARARVPGEGRPRVHHLDDRHRPQRFPGHRPQPVRQLRRPRPDPVLPLGRLLHAAPYCFVLRGHGQPVGRRHEPVPREALRGRRGLGGARVHRALGHEPGGVQLRRVPRPLDRRGDEARKRAHLHRPAAHLDRPSTGCACAPAPTPPWLSA